MKRIFLCITAFLLLFSAAGCGATPAPSSDPSPTIVPTAEPYVGRVEVKNDGETVGYYEADFTGNGSDITQFRFTDANGQILFSLGKNDGFDMTADFNEKRAYVDVWTGKTEYESYYLIYGQLQYVTHHEKTDVFFDYKTKWKFDLYGENGELFKSVEKPKDDELSIYGDNDGIVIQYAGTTKMIYRFICEDREDVSEIYYFYDADRVALGWVKYNAAGEVTGWEINKYIREYNTAYTQNPEKVGCVELKDYYGKVYGTVEYDKMGHMVDSQVNFTVAE
ncbi:MAG: hypothetical protein J6L92_00150 [Clostridia bacterium]|nr:hypothetical protein [Clostridia bacterium]